MGTYTTNYNLFMPTVGEQGWGTLVNGNFTTIDTTLKGLDTRLTAVENEVNGALSCTSVTTSGKVTANGGVGTTSLTTSSTITSTGKITANGGLGTKALTATTGTFSGAVTATQFVRTNPVTVTSSTPTADSFPLLSYMCLLPFAPSTTYTGSVKVFNSDSGSTRNFTYYTNLDGAEQSISITGDGYATLSFSKVKCLYVYNNNRFFSIGSLTLT